MNKGSINCFEAELWGVVCVSYLAKSLEDHAKALRVMIEEEVAKLNPNNALVTVLRDAACLGYEHLDQIMKRNTKEGKAVDS